MVIRVFIYDDSVARRQSLQALIALTPELVYCGEAENCDNVLAEMQYAHPDVVLMDINMPGTNGIKGLISIRSHFPEIKVLMQTVFDETDKVFESIKNGANGYVLKKDPPEKLVEAIKEAFLGGAVMNPGIAQKVLSFFAPQKEADGGLSVREKEVLRLLAEGKSYKMIAAQFELSYHTVNTHIKKIYEKLHVQSLGEAIAFYYKNLN
ncbi:MAG: response regulator transcription factor [Chitinophagaceae bacterium]|nr:response regulator transcription factor [Chitinophagaceae bacterium]